MHNYQQKLLRMIQDGTISVEQGTVEMVSVLHDDWCRALRGAGECNCDPQIVVPQKGDVAR
jgi:hypothetical protein